MVKRRVKHREPIVRFLLNSPCRETDMSGESQRKPSAVGFLIPKLQKKQCSHSIVENVTGRQYRQNHLMTRSGIMNSALFVVPPIIKAYAGSPLLMIKPIKNA